VQLIILQIIRCKYSCYTQSKK